MSRKIFPIDEQGKKILDLAKWKKDINNFNKLYFDSKFEHNCYLVLKQAGFDVDFHPESRLLMPSFTTFALSRAKSGVKLFKSTVRSISYTPDFLINCNDGTKVFIEAKGFFTDGAKMRYKLFQNSLEKNEYIFSVYDNPREGINTLKAVMQIINEKFKGSNKKENKSNTNTIKNKTISI
jgi:hypothetical protein